MGRTLPTYRNLLEEEVARWKGFRRALRKRDREAFDELMNMCKQHSSASSYSANLNSFEPMMMSMCLELWKELKRVKRKLKELRGT